VALTVGSTANATFSGNITDCTGGPGSLLKIGSGSQTLSGADTYSGTTTVNAGKLLIDGTHSGGGLYTVQSGATLGGTGSIGADLTVNAGGFLAPGDSIGTLAVTGNASLGGTLSYQVSGNTSDRLTGLQALTLSPVSTLNLIATGNAFAGAIYDVADYQTLSGTFGTILNLPSNYTIDYGPGSGAGSIFLVPLTVPEPSTLALLGVGAAAMLAIARRRRRKAR
jgi:autotransporter-associated beta strand protein